LGRRQSILHRAKIGSSGRIPDLRGDPLGRQGCAGEQKLAKHRANQIASRKSTRTGTPVPAAVIQFDIDRNVLANFETLVFTSETANDDFWDFVEHNRTGHIPHRPPAGANYEVVFGPVSVWPQRLVMKDCDQISFHTSQAAGQLVNATIIRQGSSGNPRVSP
jgi:hypothetical protein